MGSAADSRAGIRVCARFRPQNKLEQKHQAVECVRLQDGTAAHVHSEARGVSDNHTFTFDQVFGTTSSQLEVYEATAKPLVESALRGYNCTCFVYGQTGSGKTFSMEGVPGDADFEGIIPRVMADIFDGIQNMQADLEFIVRVSYIEIYMEKIRDLLKPTSTNLNVRESRERGVWIAGATEVCCASVEEMQEVMRLGGANRVISSTRMNNESSRSHSVFIITIEQRNTATGSMKSGKLFLVDLAGSEKVGKTHAKGQTLKEAQHINKSLSALGSVMNALTSGHSSTHIPYRDSKLTRLLQDSLGGNSETTLLVCASSSSYNSEETVSTLRFGTRAKSIKNKPKVNEERTVAEYKILVAEKDKRIAALETLLCKAERDATEPTESTVEEQLKVFATKVEQLEDDQASKAAELSSLEDRCAELETENKHLLEKEREVALIVSRNEDFSKKVAFLESELEAKAKECEDLSLMLARRRTAGETPPLSSDGISAVQAAIEEGKELDPEKPPSSVTIVTERSRACSTALENELLRQQLAAKTNELKICTQRVDELSKELASSRSEYDSQVEQLQQKLREFDAHLQGLGNPAVPMDAVGAKTKMLRSVRGGSRTSLLGRRSISQDTTRLSSVSSIHRQDSTGSASSQSEWKLDDEVFPVAPIDMDSEVVQRLIRSMPEKGREKISKWLGFVLEGRDIRSNFHPEISIESLNEEVNRDIKRLIVPLLKNRRDLKVQLYVRTRYVRVSDLKITLDHEHKDEMRLEASSDDGTSEGTSAAPSSSLLWAKDHLFYGPKTDASSPSVLHASRKLASSKDRFISEPIDLGASVTGSRSMLPSSRTAQKLSRKASLPFDSFHASGSGPGSGGVFSRRLKTGMGAVLGDVKTKLNARYHKNHVHEDALCNGCGISPIVGAKWSCSTCVNYELCTSCYSAGTHGFEVNNEMCRRVEQLAVQKHRSLGEYPELFELFRRHVCNDNVIQFRRIVEWLSAIVSGRARSGDICHKMIVKSGLHPDIRARLVAQLGALASQRTDISLKTEWFTESSADEDALDSDDSEDSEPTEPAPAEPDGDALSPTSTFNPSDVKLETLRMYVMDASSSKQGSEPAAAAAALSDLLDPAVADAPALRRTVSEASANSDHDEVRQLPDMQRKQSLDLPTYGRQQVKSITRLNL